MSTGELEKYQADYYARVARAGARLGAAMQNMVRSMEHVGQQLGKMLREMVGRWEWVPEPDPMDQLNAARWEALPPLEVLRIMRAVIGYEWRKATDRPRMVRVWRPPTRPVR